MKWDCSNTDRGLPLGFVVASTVLKTETTLYSSIWGVLFNETNLIRAYLQKAIRLNHRWGIHQAWRKLQLRDTLKTVQ